MAAKYRLLQDHWLSTQLVPAGTTITEGDGICPVGWVPTGNVDPLNTQAVQNFYNAGPQLLGRVSQQYSLVLSPVTFWLNVGSGFSPGFSGGFAPFTLSRWQLTGLGSNINTYPVVQASL